LVVSDFAYQQFHGLNLSAQNLSKVDPFYGAAHIFWMPLKYGNGGSLNVYIQKESPSEDQSELVASTGWKLQSHAAHVLAEGQIALRPRRPLVPSSHNEGCSVRTRCAALATYCQLNARLR
jgi:hypothetical protein